MRLFKFACLLIAALALSSCASKQRDILNNEYVAPGFPSVNVSDSYTYIGSSSETENGASVTFFYFVQVGHDNELNKLLVLIEKELLRSSSGYSLLVDRWLQRTDLYGKQYNYSGYTFYSIFYWADALDFVKFRGYDIEKEYEKIVASRVIGRDREQAFELYVNPEFLPYVPNSGTPAEPMLAELKKAIIDIR